MRSSVIWDLPQAIVSHLRPRGEGNDGRMRRLLPTPLDPVTVEELYQVPRSRPAGRPWVACSMVASVDGATVVDGTSGPLSNPTDLSVFAALRAVADWSIVGAGTVRSEGYGAPKNPRLRVVVLSTDGDLDYDTPLFTCGQCVVATTTRTRELPVPTVRAGDERVDLPGIIAQLDGTMVLCEGGAHLNGSMIAADLIDEVCLTISPHLVGGDAPRVAAGKVGRLEHRVLAHLAEENGFLFTRYVRG
jgi:riboflavin biosynthesis pyrimidine reductase